MPNPLRYTAGSPQFNSFASALMACGGDIHQLRSMGPLTDEAQRVIDSAVQQVGLERLVVARDLMEAGLTYSLPNPMSIMELYWEQESKVGHARRTMLPSSRGENQRVDRTGVRVPIYATMEDFSLNIRVLLASQRTGAPLDTTQVAQATRRVNESIEDAVIHGPGITVGGNTAYGILNAPNRTTVQFGDSGRAWDHASKTGANILRDVLNLLDAAQDNFSYGPANLYIPSAYGIRLLEDFKDESDKSVLMRLQEIEWGGRPLRVRVADRMTADTVALVQMTSDVIDIIDGMQPTAMNWASGDGFTQHFAVMAFMIPRVKDDYDGNSGIVIGNTTG